MPYPNQNIDIYCASAIIGLCAYITIALYYNIASFLFKYRYIKSNLTDKELDRLWKTRHPIIPRHGGIGLAGIGGATCMFICLIGFILQIICYIITQS